MRNNIDNNFPALPLVTSDDNNNYKPDNTSKDELYDNQLDDPDGT